MFLRLWSRSFWLDGALVNGVEEYARRDLSTGGANVGESVGFLIAVTADVFELSAFEFSFECVVHVAVRDHVFG